jgi:hypothetical protein
MKLKCSAIKPILFSLLLTLSLFAIPATGQDEDEETAARPTTGFYAFPPRWLVDMPTAGTLPRASFDVAIRLYPDGGAIGLIDIGLSNRMQLGISYGGEGVISNKSADWNPTLNFNIKFRFIDEMEYFPAITGGFCSQGFGAYNDSFDRYTFKSRGFFAVASRSFYFYNWTAGWHFGGNYSLEGDFDKDESVNFFGGFDATFQYNLAFVIEYDAALNDNKSTLPGGASNTFGGKGRGYLNTALRWLFTDNLELEFMLKDLLTNRKESSTFTREVRITYIETF